MWRLLEYPWERLEYSQINSADGIVVLSGGKYLSSGNRKIIEWYYPDRFLAGIYLYKSKKANRLIFTRGINPYSSNLPSEGDIYIREAITNGIPKKDLFTTYPVINTFQEAKAIKKLLKEEIPSNQKRIILVTSAFHMNRAKKVFEREGINVIPFPVDFKSSKSFISSVRNPLLWMPSAVYLNKSTMAIREIIGRIIYRV